MSSPLRVLFVCIGNSCRSPMAEGFARRLGDRVLAPSSAGLFPASVIQPETFQVMAERGIKLDDRPPCNILLVDGAALDQVVNMSGRPVTGLLQGFRGRESEWRIADPIGLNLDVYRQVRDEIERRVEELIEQVRKDQR